MTFRFDNCHCGQSHTVYVDHQGNELPHLVEFICPLTSELMLYYRGSSASERIEHRDSPGFQDVVALPVRE